MLLFLIGHANSKMLQFQDIFLVRFLFFSKYNFPSTQFEKFLNLTLLVSESHPDGYAYSIMISAFCRYGLLDDATKLAAEFEAKYEKYDVVIMNTMLCAYCRAGEMENVMKLMQKMDKLAINPDRNTFHILIKYFVKEKLYMLAYKTLQDMHNRGQRPDEVRFPLFSFIRLCKKCTF